MKLKYEDNGKSFEKCVLVGGLAVVVRGLEVVVGGSGRGRRIS